MPQDERRAPALPQPGRARKHTWNCKAPEQRGQAGASQSKMPCRHTKDRLGCARVLRIPSASICVFALSHHFHFFRAQIRGEAHEPRPVHEPMPKLRDITLCLAISSSFLRAAGKRFTGGT